MDHPVPLEPCPTDHPVPLEPCPTDHPVPLEPCPTDHPVPLEPCPTDHPVPLEPCPTDHPVPLEPCPTDHPVPLEPSPTERSVSPRAPLAEKAMSEAFSRLRYRDTSLLLWQQHQASMQQAAPPLSYLSRSQSVLYSNYGNQPVVVRDRSALEAGADHPGPGSGSSICSLM